MFTSLLFSLATSFGSEGPPPTLEPKTYLSPSGRYELFVDPTERQGGGPGLYELTLDGESVWKSELSYTFWEAVVTDEGHAGGFAYTRGPGHPALRGWSPATEPAVRMSLRA